MWTVLGESQRLGEENLDWKGENRGQEFPKK